MTDKNLDTAQLIYDGKNYEFPVIVGSEGERSVDITSLRGRTGLITYDPGYGNTGACKSAVTFLDGEKGILRHRGYAIDELAQHYAFVEVSFLLIFGHLPNQTEVDEFREQMKANYELQPSIIEIIKSYPDEAHPMAILSSCCMALSGLYPDKPQSDEEFKLAAARMMAQFIGIAAYTYRKKMGKEFIAPNTDYGYCTNFMHMLFGDEHKCEDELGRVIRRSLARLLIIHSDHEQNCSTSTVRMVSSAQSNMYASVSAGIAALWGPLHGGANQKVMEMLQEIKDGGGDIEKMLARAKAKEDPFRLMGFGHRVYKTYDPRAKIAKASCYEYLNQIGKREGLVDIAVQLEGAALADEYFQERNLYPNVDFYTGILYRAMGIPTEMFTVLFAIGRLPGWLSHLRELEQDPDCRIGRPRQIYTGNTARPIPQFR